MNEYIEELVENSLFIWVLLIDIKCMFKLVRRVVICNCWYLFEFMVRLVIFLMVLVVGDMLLLEILVVFLVCERVFS